MKVNITSRHDLIDSIPYNLANNDETVKEVENSYW